MEDQTDTLARITNNAFESQDKWLGQEFAAIRLEFDVRKRVVQLERKTQKIEKALNTSL